MSHTAFCWLMDQTHDGLFALVGRAEDCPICGATEVRRGAPHHVGCPRVSGSTGAEAPLSPSDAALVKSPGDIARWAGGLGAIFVGGVLLKLTFDAMGSRRVPEPLPSRVASARQAAR